MEVDLSQNAFQYKSTEQFIQDGQDDDEEIEFAKEIQEYHDISDEENKDTKVPNRRQNKDKDDTDSSEQLLPGLTSLEIDSNAKSESDNLTLLTELGLVDTRSDDFGDFQNGLLDEFLPKNNSELTDDVFDKLLNDLSVGN